MSGIHLLSRLEAFFNLTIKTARRIPATETAARRFGIFPSSVGHLRSAIVRMSYICRRLGEETQATTHSHSGFCDLRELQRWKSASHHSLTASGLPWLASLPACLDCWSSVVLYCKSRPHFEASCRRPARTKRRDVILVNGQLIMFILVHLLVLFLLFSVDIWNP